MVDSSHFLPPFSKFFFMVFFAVFKNSEEIPYKAEETKRKLKIVSDYSIGLPINCLSNDQTVIKGPCSHW